MDFKEFEALAREYCQAEKDLRQATAHKKEVSKRLDDFFEANMVSLGDLIKRKFSWADLGTFTAKPETVIYGPTDPKGRRELFDYVKEKHGSESAWKIFPAHYGALNSFYVNEANAQDNPQNKLILPGCYEPVTKLKYGFRKK